MQLASCWLTDNVHKDLWFGWQRCTVLHWPAERQTKGNQKYNAEHTDDNNCWVGSGNTCVLSSSEHVPRRLAFSVKTFSLHAGVCSTWYGNSVDWSTRRAHIHHAGTEVSATCTAHPVTHRCSRTCGIDCESHRLIITSSLHTLAQI